MWLAVIHTLLNILTIKPCRKYFPGAFLAIIYAQIIKIISQNIGSTVAGINEIVAIAIARPNNESRKINFQFIELFI